MPRLRRGNGHGRWSWAIRRLPHVRRIPVRSTRGPPIAWPSAVISVRRLAPFARRASGRTPRPLRGRSARPGRGRRWSAGGPAARGEDRPGAPAPRLSCCRHPTGSALKGVRPRRCRGRRRRRGIRPRPTCQGDDGRRLDEARSARPPRSRSHLGALARTGRSAAGCCHRTQR